MFLIFFVSSSEESASQTPDPMPNVVETPKAKETIMVLPFVKKSPCWQVLESVEILKAVPQHPHFSPLLKCKEALREGEAIRAMINFAKLLGIVGDLQVDDSLNDINSINEFFLMLEKYGFDVTAPRAKIEKLLSIKESRTWALEELQVAERVMAEKDNKRRKLEDQIVELQRQEALLKEEKVREDKEIARIQSEAVVLDQKVQNAVQEFLVTATAPW